MWILWILQMLANIDLPNIFLNDSIYELYSYFSYHMYYIRHFCIMKLFCHYFAYLQANLSNESPYSTEKKKTQLYFFPLLIMNKTESPFHKEHIFQWFMKGNSLMPKHTWNWTIWQQLGIFQKHLKSNFSGLLIIIQFEQTFYFSTK